MIDGAPDEQGDGLRVADSRSMAHSHVLDAPVSPPRLQIFADRRQAGRALGAALLAYAGMDPIVLGLPRGGVVVADEVARALGATLDVWIVRKLGAPRQPELGIGAVAEGPIVVLDRLLVPELRLSRRELFAVARRELNEVRRRVARLRGGRPEPDLRGRVVILVDDGIARGGTMRAAIRAVKKRNPERIVVAVPVATPGIVEQLRRDVDDVVCLRKPEPLQAVGVWYAEFDQVHDDEVVRILERAAAGANATSSTSLV